MRLTDISRLLGVFSLLLALTAGKTFAEEAKASKQDKSFTVVLLPDTQNYSEKYPATYVAQTMWIRQRAEKDNMKFAIHLGDIVQYADREGEWKSANRAMEIIDGVLPYSMVPGNHDMVNKNKRLTRDTTLYNKYFPPARFSNEPWYGGHLGKKNDNNYCYFEGGGEKFMVVSLEFAPSDEALKWAGEVIGKHPHHRVIVATHNYLTRKGRDVKAPTSYKIAGNSGEQMWQKLIRKHKNIFLVASGHVLGVNLQKSTNDHGGIVYEMLTDYQGLPNGGDGWLRTLKFVPGENKIYVEVYSPLLKEFDEKPEQAYTLDFQMRGAKK